MKRRWQKGSFTIEASFIIPFVLVVLFEVLSVGIGFFQDSKTRVPFHKLQEIDAVESFYKVQRQKDLVEEYIKDGV